MEAAADIRTLANRIKVWTGTVHYADNGRPSCGAATKTHSSWMRYSVATVTCARCIAQFGEDTPGHTDPVVEHHADDHAAQRAAEREARRRERTQ
jgi:hypothetical protein